MYDHRLHFLLTARQRAWLDAEAKRRGTSVSAVVRDIVDSGLRRSGSADEERAAAGGAPEGRPSVSD
jgi:hypothetical protein